MILKTVTKEIEASLVKREDHGEEGLIELHIGGNVVEIDVDDEDLSLLRRVNIGDYVNGVLELIFEFKLNINSTVISNFKEYRFKESNILYKSESSYDIQNESLYTNVLNEVEEARVQYVCSDEFQNIIDDKDRSGEDYTKEEAQITLEIYDQVKNLDSAMKRWTIQTKYIDTGRLKRTLGSVNYKLKHFLHFETNGEEGIDNWGKVFKEVWDESKR